MSSSSQTTAPVSTSRAFADLAAAIDRRVSADRAADLLVNFRNAVRAAVAADLRAALLKTTDGDDVYDDFEVPAGEVRRILAELVEGGDES